jgi:hypothetical protein
MFRGKTVTQLEALQKQIETKLSSHEQGLDVSFWETLLSQLKGTRLILA